MRIKIATRDSALAVAQAKIAAGQITSARPDIEIELVCMKTTGDKILDRTLDKIGGKGLFVRELDAALLDGRADIAVHSLKDLPMELPDALPLAAVSAREDPRDALVLPAGRKAYDPADGPIGTASPRRVCQLRALFPGAELRPVRGNLQTRLRRLDAGEYGALVLAAAGLRRLGLENRIARLFSPQELVPAAGQGILGVQARPGFDRSLLAPLHDETAMCCALAERAFVRALGGGCGAPVAAYCFKKEDGTYALTGLCLDADGVVRRKAASGSAQQIAQQGAALALEIKKECHL